MQSRTIVSHHLTARFAPRWTSATRRPFTKLAALNEPSSHLPRIARPSFWRSLVPRFIRERTHNQDAAVDAAIEAVPSKQLDGQTKWAGTSIALLGVLVGSFAINVIALRRELVTFSRKTEAKLDLLREVLRRVKAGEQVDVKKLLGTGDPEQEKEWEEIMQEIEDYNKSTVSSSTRSEEQAADPVKHVWTSWFKSRKEDGGQVQDTMNDSQSHVVKSQDSQPRFLM